MSIVDILVTIIVVTILVTIVLGVGTYLAYKLRLARRPGNETSGPSESRYFNLHEPPTSAPVAPNREVVMAEPPENAHAAQA
jgi:heme/copper-type cytochrome/quinol oxidase subunit 2